LLALGRRSLLVHKLRSALSVLGVLFGVAAVVAMSSVGEGARREALEQIGALGIDGITVRRAPGSGAEERLLVGDADALAAAVPRLDSVAPLREVPLPARSPAGREMDAVALGTLPSYGRAARVSLSAGRFLADLDVRDSKRVAVLGATVAGRLFPLEQPIGRWVVLGGEWFRVVGVLESRRQPRRPAGPIRPRDLNLAVIVPLPALDLGEGGIDEVDEIALRVSEGRFVSGAAEVTRRTLARVLDGGSAEVVVPREILAQRQRTQRLFGVVTGAVAGLGLLVGGIGIMNIMLASVAERTSEIGLRRAVGATRRDVAAQFLVEATLLTVSGGAGGIALGGMGSHAIQRLAGWPTALSAPMLLAALLMALLVGIGFGSYPAWRAARMEPMAALRTA
jgi:putative ABC transport system permease protein